MDEDAAMFDILAPPYDEQRECNFYREISKPPSPRGCCARGSGESGRSGPEEVVLQRIPQPATFYCDQLPYMGPCLDDVMSADEDE